MIEVPEKRELDFWIDALKNWREVVDAFVPILKIGGEDFSDRIPQGDYSHDGIALTLEALFVNGVPLKYWDYAPVELDVTLEGRTAPALRGLMALIEPEDERPHDKITAASAGSLADKTPLNETVTWAAEKPHNALRSALRRLPYNQRRVEVALVDEPPLYAGQGQSEEAFPADNMVNALLDKVREKVPYVLRDTAWGGHKATVSPGLAKIPEIPEYLRFSSEDLPWWKSPALALQRYAYVVVFKLNPDGSDAFDPAVANVTPFNPDYPTPRIPERIPWTGDAASAQQHAYERAKYLSRGQFKSEPGLPPFVLLERTDVFTVTEAKQEDEGGFYEREWIHYTDSFEQSWGGGGSSRGQSSNGWQTNPTCSVGLLNEQFVKAPTLPLGTLTGGIYKTPTPEPVLTGVSWASTDIDFSSTTVTFADN
jgi:hypothetical protein